MLPRTLRIQRDADFSRVYKRGQRLHTRHFVLTFVANTLTHPRFACVVPKTISKKAVVRNRVRRLVHEVLSGILAKSSPLTSAPLDVLISSKRGVEALELPEITTELSLGLKNVWSKK